MSENNKLCYEESLDDQLLAIISDDAIQSVISRRCKKQKINTKRVLVRCFKGAHNAQQEIPLNNAIQEFLDKKLVTVEYLLCDQVKKLHLTEEGVVDWLLDSDVHLIITHVHQNIVEHLGWNMDVLMYQLQKLNSHPGYPYRQLLRDPIFLQDKYDYIHIMKDFCNPTLKIAIRKDNSYSVDDLSLISSFLHEQQRNTICWMMKLAFVTNGYHMHKAKNYEDILCKLESYSSKFFGTYPYVMLGIA